MLSFSQTAKSQPPPVCPHIQSKPGVTSLARCRHLAPPRRVPLPIHRSHVPVLILRPANRARKVPAFARAPPARACARLLPLRKPPRPAPPTLVPLARKPPHPDLRRLPLPLPPQVPPPAGTTCRTRPPCMLHVPPPRSRGTAVSHASLTHPHPSPARGALVSPPRLLEPDPQLVLSMTPLALLPAIESPPRAAAYSTSPFAACQYCRFCAVPFFLI